VDEVRQPKLGAMLRRQFHPIGSKTMICGTIMKTHQGVMETLEMKMMMELQLRILGCFPLI
jgi:hypothetical protein